MWYAKIGVWGDPKVRWLLALRGLGGFFGVCGLYFSLVYLPISEAVVLTFLGPMLSCYVYSFIQPSEPYTRRQQIASYICIVGLIVIPRPISLFSLSSDATESSDNSTTTATNTTLLDSPNPNQPLSAPVQPTTSQHIFAICLSLIGVVGGSTALIAIR